MIGMTQIISKYQLKACRLCAVTEWFSEGNRPFLMLFSSWSWMVGPALQFTDLDKRKTHFSGLNNKNEAALLCGSGRNVHLDFLCRKIINKNIEPWSISDYHRIRSGLVFIVMSPERSQCLVSFLLWRYDVSHQKTWIFPPHRAGNPFRCSFASPVSFCVWSAFEFPSLLRLMECFRPWEIQSDFLLPAETGVLFTTMKKASAGTKR